MQDAARSFAYSFRVIVSRTWNIESRLTSARRMYEVVEIENDIKAVQQRINEKLGMNYLLYCTYSL